MKEETTFTFRSYGKGELAMMYSPFVSERSAACMLKRWIRLYPGLLDALERSGYIANSKRYTPAQVKLIVEALGEP